MENGGDGSAFPIFCESKELAEWYQTDHEDTDWFEGWAEDCSGYLEVEHDGELKFKCETAIGKKEEMEKYEEDKDYPNAFAALLEIINNQT